ncbi:MAG: glycosyltransferase 87 family protein [Pseudomonadota bacterium]
MVSGGFLVAMMAALIPLSQITPGPELAVTTMLVLLVAGFAWLHLIGRMDRGLAATDVLIILVLGALMRLVLLASDPILELDFYRYIWDGAAVSAGLNPYSTPPEAAISGAAGPAWSALAARSAGLAEAITYPHLSTIYPPIAQLGFALAHWIDPWGLTGLRLVLLSAEVAGVFLLIRLLDALGRNRAWVAVYWCNPLVAKELVNSAHMEALLLPFLTGAVLLAVQKRQIAASAVLALAAAVKVWPLVLAPILLAGATWRRWIAASAMLVMLTLILFAPILMSRLDQGSGFVAYASWWERNAALFPLITLAMDGLIAQTGAYLIDPGRVARLVVAAMVAGAALWLARPGAARVVSGTVAVIALLLLLSPTGYPWYYAWLLPFLCVIPNRGLVLLGALLPLYYLRFAMVDWGLGHLFDSWIVWIAFGPPLVLIAWDLRHRAR